jgi:hypothetical protein
MICSINALLYSSLDSILVHTQYIFVLMISRKPVALQPYYRRLLLTVHCDSSPVLAAASSITFHHYYASVAGPKNNQSISILTGSMLLLSCSFHTSAAFAAAVFGSERCWSLPPNDLPGAVVAGRTGGLDLDLD